MNVVRNECVFETAYFIIVGLQYVVEPGDFSQFTKVQLHTLQSAGELLLLWWVQLLQEVEIMSNYLT